MQLSLDNSIFYNNGKHILDRPYSDLVTCMRTQLSKWAMMYPHGIPGDVCPLGEYGSVELVAYPKDYHGSTVESILVQTTNAVSLCINKTQSPNHIVTHSLLVEDALDTGLEPHVTQSCMLGVPFLDNIDQSFNSAHTVLKFTDWKILLGVDKLILPDDALQYVESDKIDNVLDYLKCNYQSEYQISSHELHSFIRGFGGREIGPEDYLEIRNSHIIRPAQNQIIRISKLISDMVIGATAEEVLLHHINKLDALLLWANPPEFNMTCDLYSYEQESNENMFPHIYIRVCNLHFDRSHDEDELRDIVRNRNQQIIKKLLVEIL